MVTKPLKVLPIKKADPSEEFELPSYSKPGRILVEIISTPSETKSYKYEFEVHDYDSDSSVFWINEGTGFDFFLDQTCDFPCLGWHVIENIKGEYIRGTWGFDDDDEIWEFESIRPATVEEIKTGTLS